MFGSQTLEVAMGLVFIYLLLSLICSALNEWVATFWSMRSKTLESGLRNLLDDPQATRLAKALYGHPLIKSLAPSGSKPSYIPSRAFARALMDVLAPSDAATGPKAFADLRNAVAILPASGAKNSLLVLIDEAQGDLSKAREKIEEWFDHATDRVSGWYKRKTKLISVVWALVLAVTLNADTLMIANNLWHSSTLRASVTAAAEAFAKQPPSAVTPPPGAVPIGPPSGPEVAAQIERNVQGLDLPIGWSPSNEITRAPGDFRAFMVKVIGLLCTTLAVSLGAPFWFNVLKDIGGLRSAGQPPERRA